jgi:glucose/mannose-6-phosphate isomerase
MNKLDDLEQIKIIDKDNMAKYISEMPSQIEQSFKKISGTKLPEKYSEIDGVCFCGIGGSASAADVYLNQNFENHKIPMALSRDGKLPGWAGKNTLVVLISHSGITKETEDAFKQAATKESKIIVICEKGEIEKWAKSEKAIVLDYDTKATPRASIGYQFGTIAGLNNVLNLGPKIDLSETIQTLKNLDKELCVENPTEKNMAKHIAFSILDHEPKIIGSGILNSVARRWKNQFNENSKSFAYFDSLPEAMHNSIEGILFPERTRDDSFFVLLRNSFDSIYESSLLDKWSSLLEENNMAYELLEATGENIWTQKFSMIFLGDWASYYLAILNGIDPTPVPTITKYK